MIKNIINHRVFYNSLAMLVVQATQYITPFLMLALLTKRLGIESFSLLAFITAIIQFSNVVTDYGFYLSATEKLSKKRSSKKFVQHILGSVISWKLFLYLIVSITITCFALTSDQYANQKNTILLALGPVFANTFLPTWFFQGLEKMNYIMWVAIGSKVTTALILWLLIRDSNDTNLVLIIITLVSTTASTISYWIIYRMGYYPELSLKHLRYTALYGLQYFIARISSASFTSINGIILGLFVSVQAVGNYSIALQFYTGLHSLFVPIYHATYPYMARERKINFIFKILGIIIPALLFVSVIAYYIFPYLLKLLAISEFNDAANIFNIMLIILIVNILSSFIGYPFFVAIGKNYIANYSIMAGAIWHLSTLLGITIFWKLNAINVAYVALTSEFIILIIRLWFVCINLKLYRR